MTAPIVLERPHIAGLPQVGIELIALTPEQLRSPFPNHLIGRTRRLENVNSWVRGIVDLLIVYLSDTNGTMRTTGASNVTTEAATGPKLSFTFANTGCGVKVGTGTTAVDRDDIDIETPIVSGSGAGQLVYTNPGTITKTAAITGGHRVILERSFANNSGGDITITEAGIVVASRTTSGTNISPLILRDIISPGHTVVNGGAVIVRYLLDWLA